MSVCVGLFVCDIIRSLLRNTWRIESNYQTKLPPFTINKQFAWQMKHNILVSPF